MYVYIYQLLAHIYSHFHPFTIGLAMATNPDVGAAVDSMPWCTIATCQGHRCFFLICRWYIYICTYYIYRYIYYIWHILICRCRWQIGACHLNMFAGHQRNLWVHWCSQWSAMLQTARALVDMPDGSYGSGAVWKSRVPWNGSGSILGKLVA